MTIKEQLTDVVITAYDVFVEYCCGDYDELLRFLDDKGCDAALAVDILTDTYGYDYGDNLCG